MAEKVLMKGNEALAESALRAGCRFFFGYPITPQTELAAYMSSACRRWEAPSCRPSEIAAINMVYGAAAAGARHDVVVVAGHLAEGRGHLLHGRRRSARRHHQRAARRPGPRRHPAVPGRLLAGHPRARPRRLPRGRVRAVHRPGDGRLRVLRIRRGRPVPHARHDPGRRHARPDDGARGHARAHRLAAREALGHRRPSTSAPTTW